MTEKIEDVILGDNFGNMPAIYETFPVSLTNVNKKLVEHRGERVILEVDMSLDEIREMLIEYCKSTYKNFEIFDITYDKYLLILNEEYGFYVSNSVGYNGRLAFTEKGGIRKYGVLINGLNFRPVKDVIVDAVNNS